MCCTISFAGVLWMIFASVFSRDIGLQFFFPDSVRFWFWYQDNTGLVNELGSVPLSFIFWDSLKELMLILLEMFSKITQRTIWYTEPL